VGRLFREFAVTLSVAIAVSLVVSLTTTPTMCAKFLRPSKPDAKHNIFYRLSEWSFNRMLGGYTYALRWVLRFQPVTLTVTIAVAVLSGWLYYKVPKGFFPQQDTGRIHGTVIGAQDISFQSMAEKMRTYVNVVMADPAVDTMAGFTGGNTALNQGRFFVMLKPLEQRGPCRKQHFWDACHYASADDVINRLRGKLAVVPGATLILQSSQELSIGARYGNAQYQYTLQSADINELNAWAPRLLQKMRQLRELRDQNSDQQDKGLEAKLVIDRDTASRLGITPQTLDNALYDAFGQRLVSTMYLPLNQYHVVMEVAPQFQQTPEALRKFICGRQTDRRFRCRRSLILRLRIRRSRSTIRGRSLRRRFRSILLREYRWGRRRMRLRTQSAALDFRLPSRRVFRERPRHSRIRNPTCSS